MIIQLQRDVSYPIDRQTINSRCCKLSFRLNTMMRNSPAYWRKKKIKENILSCTLHWFTREDAECVPDHEPIRHRELLEALSFQGTQIQAVRHHVDPVVTISFQLPRIDSSHLCLEHRYSTDVHLPPVATVPIGWSWAAP